MEYNFNYMLDAERNNLFEEKKQEVINQLLGDVNCPINDNDIYREIDKNWKSRSPFYNRPRILKNMNVDTSCLNGYYDIMRQNGGVFYRSEEEPDSPSLSANSN